MKNKDFWKTMIQLLISILTAALTAMGTTSCMGRGPFYEPANLAHTQGVALGYVQDAPSGRAPYTLLTTPYALRTIRTVPFVH